jgi:hypothetical protein
MLQNLTVGGALLEESLVIYMVMSGKFDQQIIAMVSS